MEQDRSPQPTVWVDADACPLTEEIETLCASVGVSVQFVASYDHFSLNKSEAWTFIERGSEAVDLYIMSRVRRGDGAITQDIGLGSVLLSKGVLVITPRGKILEEDTVDIQLAFRYEAQKMRRRGNYGKGPKKWSKDDEICFFSSFEKMLSNLAGIPGQNLETE
ncbi:YaiI/YqxD family protein [Bacillus fonticola]|uniref:YaiI/YqxD family protein n=1 Tax=Bacillus fonticola TaxID=2728853 RepID=UPI00147478D0|nr:DUF188 domain-containing protein [Bacillus fonticola]